MLRVFTTTIRRDYGWALIMEGYSASTLKPARQKGILKRMVFYMTVQSEWWKTTMAIYGYATFKGISIFNIQTKQVRNLTVANGLPLENLLGHLKPAAAVFFFTVLTAVLFPLSRMILLPTLSRRYCILSQLIL